MEKFSYLQSPVIPLPQEDVDTDQIIPARYLKVTEKEGLARGLFSGWRYLPSGEENPQFPLNMPRYKEASILLVGRNFGCGSSREHAAWALVQWGIRAAVSTSFADIFRSNALKNGLLPVEVSGRFHSQLFDEVQQAPAILVRIDLEKQEISIADRARTTFPIDPFSKKCLMEGLDPLGYLLKLQQKVADYEAERGMVESSWLYSTK